MELRLIIAGLGGQGVVLLTRLIAHSALALGHPVMVSETHGMSQRGGSVSSHLKIGGSDAPLIRRGTADVLLAIEAEEAVRNLPYLRPGGVVFVNSENGLPAELKEHIERLGLRVCSLPASKMALELGTPTVTNVLMAAFASAHPEVNLPLETLRETIVSLVSRGRELNLKALEAGYHAGLPLAPLSRSGATGEGPGVGV